MASTSHSTDQSASGFEGCEKNLKIEFHPRADLRSITRKEWDAILDDARCTIISERHNEHFNSYVLSESSLFVFPNRMILKTCGTTFLLNCLPALLRAATRIGTEPVFVQFSRSNFMFPNKQPVTHRNFSLEVKYLNTFFKSGQAYVLGPLNGPRWHLYIANMQDKPERRDPTFEMVMFDLDEAKMRQFFKSTDPSDGLAEDGPGATTLSGIDKIIPNADIDSFLFSPCGYSCNALIGPYYFTIHITPEPLCSFVSFETNVPVKDYNALVQTVADTFKPGSFAVSLLVDQHADSYNLVEKKLHGYKERASTFQKFEGAYNITCGQFLAEGRAPNPKYLHEAKEKEEPLEDEDTGKFVVSYSSARELDAVRLRALAVAAVEEIRPVASIQDDEDCSCTVARLVDHEEPDQALCVVDLDQLVARFQRWCELFPRVRPLYNVKCNNDVGVIRALNAFGCGFSCGSASEMKHVLSQGVKPSRLLFCAPYMQQSQLRFAQQHRTGLIAFHSLPTLESMVKHAPNTELLVRLCGASLISKQSNFVQSHEHLHHAHHSGQKLGVSLKDVPALLAAAKALDAKVVGVTLSLEANASIRSLDDFRAGLNGCRQVFDMAAKILGYELSVVDIGGGFPDGTSGSFDMEELASELNADLTRLFPEPVRVMARPSRFLVTSSHKVAVSVIARREVAVGREQEEPVAASSSTPLPLHDSVSIKSLASTDEDKSPRSTSSGSPPHSRSTTPPPGSSSAAYTAHEREMALLREASDDEDSLRLSSSKLEGGEAGSDRGFLYYVNDGLLAYLLYGDKRPLVPKVLETTSFKQRKSLAKDHKCAIFGPDSECMDPIVPHGQLPELHMGDWLLFENMGTCPLASPGVALACDPPLVRYVTRG